TFGLDQPFDAPKTSTNRLTSAATSIIRCVSIARLRQLRTRREYYQKVPSIARVALGVFRFLTLIQVFEGPDLYGASTFLETIPSRPSLQKDERIASHVFTLISKSKAVAMAT